MSSLDQEIRSLIQQGRKMEAVRKVMEQTGKGLKEAKAYVDSLASSDPEMPVGVSRETLEFEARQLIERGNKIAAVKKVRELTGWGLKEAKDFVDSL